MNKEIVVELVNVIGKSNDKNVIYKALVKLRIDLFKDKSGIDLFYKCGGIPPLVRLISKPYEKILDVALSILGNCCTSKDCCKQAILNGVVPPLLTILKSIPSTTVQCRACRLIGNLARESNEKICNLVKGVGITIAVVLEDSKDIKTINMAIRAVRLLWKEMVFYEEFVRHDGVKKIIGILVQYTKIKNNSSSTIGDDNQQQQSIVERYPEERARVDFMTEHIPSMESVNSKAFDREILKKSKPIMDNFDMHGNDKDLNDLFGEILRSLQTITYGLSIPVLFNFFANELGCNCIVFFAKHDSPFRARALQILSNLSISRIFNEFLSKADAVTVASNLITKKNLEPRLSEDEERHCISIICFLAYDSCNRAKIRHSGAFNRIMEIAKNTKSDSILTMILIGLLSFKYDNISIDLLIKIGLVDVLVERLDINIRDLKENHLDAVSSSKRLRFETNSKFFKGIDEIVEENILENNVQFIAASASKRRKTSADIPSTSPSINSTTNYSYPSSPCSSSSISPKCTPPRNNELYEDMDSDYSPVCSDIDDVNDDEQSSLVTTDRKMVKDHDKDNFSLMKLLEENGKVDNNELVDDQFDEELLNEDKNDSSYDVVEKKETVQLIIEILCSVSYRIKHASDLCKPEILNTLVRTCRVSFRRKIIQSRWDEHGAPLVLSRIIKESCNFVPIIKQNIIFEIYKMTQNLKDHDECSQCLDLKLVGRGLLGLLNDVGETGYGRGEMAHLLLKGDRKTHKQVAVVVTYIISNPKILHTLLVECGGLYTTMEIILTKDEDLCNEAACGLTALSEQLKISVKKYNEDIINKTNKFDKDKKYITEADKLNDCIVTFIAGCTNDNQSYTTTDSSNSLSINNVVTKDMNCIEFNETILINSSDVFSLMLNSDFKESKEKEINLNNQTILGIKYFLNCIEQISLNHLLNTPESNEIGAVLETYDMCQIYLLPELEKNVFNMILYLLNINTVLEIFEFSMTHFKPELSEIAINFYLSANCLGEEKVAMYRAADNSEYFKEWNQMMLDKIVYTCQNLII